MILLLRHCFVTVMSTVCSLEPNPPISAHDCNGYSSFAQFLLSIHFFLNRTGVQKYFVLFGVDSEYIERKRFKLRFKPQNRVNMAQRVVGSTNKTVTVEKTKKENKSVAASPPMFENKFLDSLTRVSPKEVFIIYIPTGNHPLTHSLFAHLFMLLFLLFIHLITQ